MKTNNVRCIICNGRAKGFVGYHGFYITRCMDCGKEYDFTSYSEYTDMRPGQKITVVISILIILLFLLNFL